MLKPKQDVLFTLILFSVAIEQWLGNMFFKSMALFWDTDTTIVFSLQNIHLHKYNFSTVLEDLYVPEAHLSMLDLAPFWKKKKNLQSKGTILSSVSMLYGSKFHENGTNRSQTVTPPLISLLWYMLNKRKSLVSFWNLFLSFRLIVTLN